MNELPKLKARYNKVVRKLNKLNQSHEAVTTCLYSQKAVLYAEIYQLASAPTDKMIRRVALKLTPIERKHVRVLWNTPPEIDDLEPMWCDD